MQKENIKEYKLIRDELNIVKNCMTNYVGYVLGGSGVAIFGLASIAAMHASFLIVEIISLLLSVLVSLVLMILFYKFNSHNRFAGYCKLLNHERFAKVKNKNQTAIMAWEVCLDNLRLSTVSDKYMIKLCASVKIKGFNVKKLNEAVKDVSGGKPVLDKKRFWSGVKQIWFAFLGRSKTQSWGFPPFVTAMFLIISAGFLCLGIVGMFKYAMTIQEMTLKSGLLITVSILVLFGELYLWIVFCKKLHTLMLGSATVDSFYWRFLPVRADFLNKSGIIPRYI